MSTVRKPRYTPEEYLEIERRAEYKNEYFNGEIFAMSGATRAHNLITINIGRELSLQLRQRPCEAYSGDMRVRIPRMDMYTYPDLTVVCGEPKFEDSHLDTLLNPELIIEVLSRMTEAYDRGQEFANYRRIDSLLEYVLVAQDEPRIERFSRQADGTWNLSEARGLEELMDLRSIDASLRLTDVYEKVRFDLLEE